MTYVTHLQDENARLREENNRLNYELGVADYPGKKELVAELTRLREELERKTHEYDALWERTFELKRELARLRGHLEREHSSEDSYAALTAQRDTLLAALGEIDRWSTSTLPYTLALDNIMTLARAAIAEVEGGNMDSNSVKAPERVYKEVAPNVFEDITNKQPSEVEGEK